MKSIHLVFGAQWDIIPGSTEQEFEELYQKTLKPFVSTLYEIEKLQVTLFFSGTILELLEKLHPEFFNILDEMMKRQQVELLGGGYYSPAFSIIPLNDKLGQIEMLTTYIRSHFGKRPRGFWSSQPFWDIHFPTTLSSCGLEYCFLNDYAFQSSGVKADDLFYAHYTEELGKNISILPLLSEIQQDVFLADPKYIIRALKMKSRLNNRGVVSIIADGTQFQKMMQPGNNNRRIDWLKDLAQCLESSKKHIRVLTAAEYIKRFPLTRKVYLNGNYSKSFFHALYKNGKNRVFSNGYIKSTHFKQFMNKYHESNLLYAKMMYTNVSVGQLRGDKYRKLNAKEELWKAQNHTGYWHGDHEGIYSPRLRSELYKNLINAEKVTRVKGVFFTSIISTDFDFDGENELLYQSNEMNVYVHLNGGIVFELDYIPVLHNYGNSLTRQHEHYHKQSLLAKLIQKPKADISVDSYPRKIFCDHFFSHAVTFQGWKSGQFQEAGDFLNTHYTLKDLKREQRQITLERTGIIRVGKSQCPVYVEKKYIFKKNTVQICYTLINKSPKTFEIAFASELNTSFASPNKDDYSLIDQSGKTPALCNSIMSEKDQMTGMVMEDRIAGTRLNWNSSVTFSLWHQAVYANIYRSGIMIDSYQHMCDMLVWKISLVPEKEWQVTVELVFEKV
ncbi:MAG: DUF1926 domain-containing protein [Spirochaetales bacterium]|nr:DUF1926 domain-containing protein [Spirochaetales bacterium]